MKRSLWVAAFGVLALAVSAVAASARDDGPDQAKLIAAALAETMGSAQRSFTVPAAAALGRTARPGRFDAIPTTIKDPPSGAELETQRARGRVDLARFTTGAALDKNVGTMDRWIDAQMNGTDDPGFRPLGGGVSAVRLTSMTVQGPAADVSALVTAHLVQRDGQWLVDEYRWEFAPR